MESLVWWGVAAGKTGKLHLLQDPKKRKPAEKYFWVERKGREVPVRAGESWRAICLSPENPTNISKLIFATAVEH